jgi:outer membrane receptor protein involved in Fe transport
VDELPVEEIEVRAPARLPGGRSAGDGLEVLVLDVRELQATGARTLQDALENVPGLHLADEQGNSFQQDLSLRGFTASPVTGLPQGLSVFLDGVRVNEPAVEEVNFDLVPLSDVERLEIVRGPAVVFGRNTLGGALHVITRRGGPRPEAGVAVGAGHWRTQSMRASAGGPLGPLDGYLSATETTEQGWRASGGSKVLRGFTKLGLRRGGGDVALSYQVQVSRLEEPGSLPRSMREEDQRQNYTAGDFFHPELHLVTLNARRLLARGLSLAVNAHLRALDAEQFNSSRLSPDTRLFNRTRTGGGTLELEHRARLAALKNRLTAGAELSYSDVRIAVHQEPNAWFDTTEEGLPLPALTSALSDGQLAAGAFVRDDLELAEGPLAGLRATAAVRADSIAHHVVDTSPDAPGKATGHMAFSSVAPAVGLSWRMTPLWLAAASYAEGFRAPAFLELTCADPAAPCVGLQAGVAPDTSLAPLSAVRSRAWEAGVTASPLAGLVTTLNAFRIDLRDDVFSVTPAGTSRVIFENVGPTRRQGLQLSLTAERGPIVVGVAWAFTRATFESELSLATARTPSGLQTVRPGSLLPMSPVHRGAASARVRALRWLVLTAGVQVVGPQFYRGDEANEAPRLPAYATVRAGAEARFGRWTASLRAANLLDHRYDAFGTFARDGRLAGEPVVPFLTPGAPRRVLLGMEWNLD